MKEPEPVKDIIEKSNRAQIREQRRKLTRRQVQFIEYWLDPLSESYANAYESAVRAGFSKTYARTITVDARDLDWVKEAKKQLAVFEPEHIYRAFQGIAKDPKAMHRDKLKALELMGKARGMFIDRQQQDVTVKFVNDVPRPENEKIVVDVETPDGDRD